MGFQRKSKNTQLASGRVNNCVQFKVARNGLDTPILCIILQRQQQR